MKVLKILQSFSQGTFIAFMLLLFGVNCMGEPGYLDFDNLPETNFTCAGKVIGGYYADLEASCQMFHVCTIGQGDEPMDIKFLCLNGTVFDQETRVCERVDEVDCSKSEKFYYLNLELYGNTIIPSPEEGSSEEDGNDGASSTTTSSTTTTTTSTTTVKPPTTTPSRRFIFNNNHNNKGPFTQPISSSTVASPMHAFSSTPKSPADDEDYEYEDDVEYGAGEKPANQGGSGSLDGGAFSPQQFTLQQQQQPKTEAPTKAGQSPVKPAVSFQQQHFQNGGTLTVTNSHVTVTTHTTGVGGPPTPNAAPSNGTSKPKVQTQQILLTHKQKQQFEHQKRQQQEQLLQQQAITKQHEELQKRQQEAAVKQQQKALQQQQKQVQQHEAEIKNHQALLLLHTQKINRAQQKQPAIPSSSSSSSGAPPPTQRSPFLGGSGFGSGPQQQQQQTQAPKRIPLLASASPLVLPSPSSPLTPFRLRAQGFKLPPSVAPPPTQQRQDILRQQQQQLQQHQQHHHHQQQHPEQERFEGYRRQPPPQYPVRFQVPLHLPFEQPLRNQKDISLQFDPEVEDLTQIPQHKELKRSDPPFHHTPGLAPPPAPPLVAKEPASERKSGPVQSEAVPPGADPGTGPGVEPVVEYEYDDEEEEDYSSEGDEPGPGSHGLDSAKSNTNSEFVIAQNGPPNGGSSDETEHPGEAARRSDGRPNSNSNSRSGNSNSSNSGSTSSSNSNSNDRSAKKLPSGSGSNTSRFIINNEHHKSHGSGGGSGTVGSSSSGAAPRVQPSARSPPAGPKVIVTTSTSIRDNHGRTINYSITSNGGSFSTAASHSEAGSALTTSRPAQSPQQQQQQQQPVTRGYDEYKDERDVLSDPFFRDVPRTGPVVRTRRSPSAVPRGRRSFILLVPRFM